MNEQAKALLAKRRDRTIAIILGQKERECDAYLPLALRDSLRKVVLDQINDFYDLALDLLNSLDNGQVVLNSQWLEKLDAIYEKISSDSNG